MYTANPADSSIHTIRMRGSGTIPLVLQPDNCVGNVTVTVVRKLLYDGLIKDASFSRAHQSVFDFVPGKGVEPEPLVLLAPFTDELMGEPA